LLNGGFLEANRDALYLAIELPSLRVEFAGLIGGQAAAITEMPSNRHSRKGVQVSCPMDNLRKG
jgi:hypothetical protein